MPVGHPDALHARGRAQRAETKEVAVFLIACVVIALVSVPLTAGRLGRLATPELRGVPLVVVALAAQIVVISVIPGSGGLHRWLHVSTYLIGLGFVALNLRRLPGVWIVGLGGLCNFVAITANSGVMPASPGALESAGLVAHGGAFANSATVRGGHLTFLGDVFAIPSSLPLHNVFSLGDVLIAVGIFVVVHRVCGSVTTAHGRAARAARRAPTADPVAGLE